MRGEIDQGPSFQEDDDRTERNAYFVFGFLGSRRQRVPRQYVSFIGFDFEGGKIKGENFPIKKINQSSRFDDVAFDFKQGVVLDDVMYSEEIGEDVEIQTGIDEEVLGIVVRHSTDLECELGALGHQLLSRKEQEHALTEMIDTLRFNGGSPVSSGQFFNTEFEQQPLKIERGPDDYN